MRKKGICEKVWFAQVLIRERTVFTSREGDGKTFLLHFKNKNPIETYDFIKTKQNRRNESHTSRPLDFDLHYVFRLKAGKNLATV